MRKSIARRPARVPVFESLEKRTLLAGGLGALETARAESPALLADVRGASRATRMLLAVQSGSLGQAITFTVTVRAAAALGPPTGSVSIDVQGGLVQTLTLAPAPSPNGRFAFSAATYTIPAGAGGPAYYFGAHKVTAEYTSSGMLRSSRAHAVFRVGKPAFATMSDGLKVATVVPGSGPAIAAGQTASMLYTGYLERGGSIFDDSDDHGGMPFTFTVEANPEQVIPGFDQGTVGMQVGETRVLEIPSSLAYGTTGSPPEIPPNAALVFLITLKGIS